MIPKRLDVDRGSVRFSDTIMRKTKHDAVTLSKG